MSRLALPASAFLVIFTGWELYCYLFAPSPLVLPSPSHVITSLYNERHVLLSHTLSTASVAIVGFTMSIVFACLVSVGLYFTPWTERMLMPVFVSSQTIPLVALAPLVILWFGFGLLPKIILVIWVTFFPMLLSLLYAYRECPNVFKDLLISMGANRWTVFLRAVFPSARSGFFSGLRISATYAIVATIFAEYAGARQGIGIYIISAKNNFRADLVLAAVFVSAALTLTLLGALRFCEWLTDKKLGVRKNA